MSVLPVRSATVEQIGVSPKMYAVTFTNTAAGAGAGAAGAAGDAPNTPVKPSIMKYFQIAAERRNAAGPMAGAATEPAVTVPTNPSERKLAFGPTPPRTRGGKRNRTRRIRTRRSSRNRKSKTQ
jgi:hypothetical protein